MADDEIDFDTKHRDLVIAFRACLDPETEVAPTVEQKMIVRAHLRVLGYRGQIMAFGGMPENELFIKEGRRAFSIAIDDLIAQDPIKPKQGQVNAGRTQQRRNEFKPRS